VHPDSVKIMGMAGLAQDHLSIVEVVQPCLGDLGLGLRTREIEGHGDGPGLLPGGFGARRGHKQHEQAQGKEGGVCVHDFSPALSVSFLPDSFHILENHTAFASQSAVKFSIVYDAV
jgi:hypothetical protein